LNDSIDKVYQSRVDATLDFAKRMLFDVLADGSLDGNFGSIGMHIFAAAQAAVLLSDSALQDAKAVEALNVANPKSIEENIEYGGYIYRDANGAYGYTDPLAGEGTSWSRFDEAQALIPSGSNIVGFYHTHGDYSRDGGPDGPIREQFAGRDDFGSDDFSPSDKTLAILRSVAYGPQYRDYVATPSSAYKAYNPTTNEFYYLGH
jgi:hypothetical protein